MPPLLHQAPERFRRWFPFNKFNSEVNAFITVLGFAWLVGPSELKEVEVEYKGRTERWKSGGVPAVPACPLCLHPWAKGVPRRCACPMFVC